MRPQHREDIMKKALILLAAITAVTAAMPESAHAQRSRVSVSFGKSNPFSFAPYVGGFKDAMDISEDDENTGYLIGFRTGYDLGRRTRLVADVAYGQSDDVANSAGAISFNTYDNNWIMTTGGVEYDILPGPTRVTFAAQAGSGWRKVSFDEAVGAPAEPDLSGGYVANLMLVPRISVRHTFSSRTSLDVSVLDQIFPEDRVQHSPALTVGFMFR